MTRRIRNERSIILVNGEYIDILTRHPTTSNHHSVVIFVSGLGMTMHEWGNSFDEIAQRLCDIGVSTIQFQFPIFHGDTCQELPLSKRAIILNAVIHWVRTKRTVEGQDLGLVAQSYGVPTALMSDLSGMKSVVCISGAFFPKKSIARVYEERGITIDFHGVTTLPRSSGEYTSVDREFWNVLEQYDDIPYAKRLSVPVLVFHGTEDTKIPVADAKDVFENIGSMDKQLVIVQGGDHGIIDVSRELRDAFVDDIVQWFRRTL